MSETIRRVAVMDDGTKVSYTFDAVGASRLALGLRGWALDELDKMTPTEILEKAPLSICDSVVEVA